MTAEVIEAFSRVGLEVGPEKCHWTSFPIKPEAVFSLASSEISWERSITFVGSVIDLAGNDAAALDHRIAQATKVWGKWRKVLCCRHVAPLRRARLIYTCVFASALWLAECWNPTKALLQRLNSWGARTLALAYGVRKSADEDPVQFWRRLHRLGHDLYGRLGGSLLTLRTANLHRWAGHLARAPDGILRAASDWLGGVSSSIPGCHCTADASGGRPDGKAS